MRFALGFTVLLMSGATPIAQQEPARAGWTPTLEVRVLSAWPEGTQTNAFVGWKLGSGREPIAGSVVTGPTLCDVGIGRAEPPRMPTTRRNVWKMSGEYLGEKNGRHQVRITSGFSRLNDQESSERTIQTFSLREGDNVALDVLRGPLDGVCQTHTLVIDARLTMTPDDSALAHAQYSADLWLVHTSPGGPERREHLIMNIDGLQAVPFQFNTLLFPLPSVDPGTAQAAIRLAGIVRVRPRADGLVDVDIDTIRTVFGLDQPASGNGPWTSASPTGPATARKTLTLKTGETTAIEFPPPRGFVMRALQPAGGGGGRTTVRVAPIGPVDATVQPPDDDAGVEIRDGRIRLYTDRFFKGHRTQLLLTLRRSG